MNVNAAPWFIFLEGGGGVVFGEVVWVGGG